MVWRALLVAALTGLAAPGWAEEAQIPEKSFEVLQEVFTGVRDSMLDANDHYWHAGQFERCIATLRLITEMDPTDTRAFDDAAWLMQNQLRDDEAEEFLLQGLEKNRDKYDMYDYLGLFYYTHDRPTESVFYYEQAMIMGAPRIVWHKVAHSYEHAGHFYDALNIWIHLREVETDSLVPQMQFQRMISGKLSSNMPKFLTEAKEQRIKAAEEKARGEQIPD